MGGKPAWRWFAVALLLALSAFVQFTVVTQTRHDGVIRGDAMKYVFYAYNLDSHHAFSRVQTFGPGHEQAVPAPDKLTLPGYPAFLSLFVDGIPDQAMLARATLAQAALGVLSTLLSFLIARRVLPWAWAMGAGVLVAIQPHLATASSFLVTEPLFTALMLAAVLAGLHAMRPEARGRDLALAGLLLGAASLVRPQLVPLPFLLLALALPVPGLRPRLRGIALAFACFLAVVGPWQLRNSAIPRPAGEPDLLAAALYHGSFPGFMYRDDPRTLGYAYRFDNASASRSTDVSAALAGIGEGFAAEPARYLRWYLLGKPGYFLSWGLITGPSDILIYRVASTPFEDASAFRLFYLASRSAHWPLVLLAMLGATLFLLRPRLYQASAERRQAVFALSALLVFLVVLHAIGAPYPRYNIPFRPLFFIMGLATLRWTLQWAAAHQARRIAQTEA